MPAQTTNRVLMIRPAAFGFNPETAESNTFQQNVQFEDPAGAAVEEFDRFVEQLRGAGIEVNVVQDTPHPPKPDAIFPNNWISFHEGGTAILYPMANPSRQAEVRPEVAEQLGYRVRLDLRSEAHGRALEGTGSIVFDRANRIGYACLSPRTDPDLLQRLAHELDVRMVTFRAKADGRDIYHTNVVMALGEKTAVVCIDAVEDSVELLQTLHAAGKAVLDISTDQMNRYAGNMLQLRGSDGPVWVMSQSALNSLDTRQRNHLENEGLIVAADIRTIETLGGGSARCMIAELF